MLGIRESHFWRNFPLFNQSNKVVHNLQEDSTIGEVGKSYHQTNAALESRQANYEFAIVEIEGTLTEVFIY